MLFVGIVYILINRQR